MLSKHMNAMDQFENILDECIERLSQGDDPQKCLEAFPVHAAELKALLALVSQIQRLPIPSAEENRVLLAENKMLQAARQKYSPQAVSIADIPRYIYRTMISWLNREKRMITPVLRGVVIFILVAIIAGAFTISASANSLPGDPLYGVKRIWENIQLSLTGGAASHQAVLENIQDERKREIQSVIEQQRTAVIEIHGEVQEVRKHTLKIADMWLVIKEPIENHPAVGDQVLVNVEIQTDGEVEVKKVDIIETNVPGQEEMVWVTPIPYWNLYQPNEWQTLVPTEYHTLIPTDIMKTVVPTQYQTYIPEDLNTIPTLISTLVPPELQVLDEENWQVLIPAMVTQIPEDWPNLDPSLYSTYIPNYTEGIWIPPDMDSFPDLPDFSDFKPPKFK